MGTNNSKKDSKTNTCHFVSSIHNDNEDGWYHDVKFINSGHIAVGFLSYQPNHMGVITKFGLNGEIVWNKKFYRDNESLIFISIETITNSNDLLVLCKSFSSTSTLLYVLRIDDSGIIKWSKVLHSSNELVNAQIKRLTYNSGLNTFIITAQYQNNSTVVNEFYKIDEQGSLLLAKDFRTSRNNYIYDTKISENGFVVAGITLPNSTNLTGWLMHLDTDFTSVFAKRIGQSNINTYFYGATLNQATNTIYIAGRYHLSTNLYVGKFNSDDTSFTIKEFDLVNNVAHMELVLNDNTNAIYLVINFQDMSTTTILKLDKNLNEIWRKKINIESRIEKLIIQDSNLVLCGVLRPPPDFQLIAHTDLDLNSCITETLQSQPPLDKVFTTADFTPDITNITPVFQNISIISESIDYVREDFCNVNCNEGVVIDENTYVQSSYLYLQATGSDGNDSTSGRHLRWAFKGALGEKHLPKGKQAIGTDNFNKPDDFVKISRALYQPYKTTLDFVNSSPEVVDNGNFLWIYRIGEKDIYIRFKDHSKYNEVLNTTDPLSQPYQFIQNYGNKLIEVENISSLFFAVGFSFTNVNSNSHFKVETLSVKENKITADKVVSNRNTFTQLELNDLGLVCENGRSIRLQQSDVQISSISFEYYKDFVLGINNSSGWEEIGNYALTLDDATAFSQLEQNSGDVHGAWKRFNDDAFVNIQNYQNKWNESPEEGDRNIKMIVDKYIELSNDASNPTANEIIQLGNDPNDPNDNIQVSNLDLLNLAANDYHIARMLGLGTLDVDKDGYSYVYIAEYATSADLEDGLGVRNVNHVFMSLPTSINDSRLPIPINLKEISFGLQNTGEGTPLTDEDGYTADGLSRYIRLFSEELPEPDINAPFYISNDEVNRSTLTSPIFGGLEHKIGSSNWQKPELSHDKAYYNVVPKGEDPYFETRYLLVPEPQMSYYVHRQRISGQHIYEAYSINWFSRATKSSVQLSTDTLLKQINPLKPPSNTNALLIREESPLLLTSQEEQNRLNAIINTDKTLIRLSFNYHSTQELKDYRLDSDLSVTNEQIVNPANADNPTILFPDNKEIFAKEIEVFFRKDIPNNTSGKVLEVIDHNDEETLSVITTDKYIFASTGEKLTPYIKVGTESNYIGGIFILGENKYVIFEITQGTDYPIFTVYKKEISDAILAGNSPSSVTYDELEPPVETSDGLFMAIENMQNTSSWGIPNPLGLKVNVENEWPIHREVIEMINDDGIVERHVEKTRGIWKETTITEELEPDPNNPNNNIFQGLYKIEFNTFILDQHSQYSESDISVEWFRGSVRIFTEGSLTGEVPNETRKLLSVLRIENISTSENPTTDNLVLYAQDPTYSNDTDYDSILIGNNIEVNYYPGYKIYLYENASYGIDEQNILPDEGEGVSNSIFGFRSMMHDCDESGNCYSKISVPSIMIAEEIIEAETPELPSGSLYATRPDFFGRSTYTIKTKFNHKPHGVLFYRSNDEALLNVLYEKQTIIQIRESIKVFGGNNEEYLVNRWNNFLNFDELNNDGDFKTYPPSEVSPDGYKFPNPDKQAFFDWANSILEVLEQDLITENPGTLTVGNPKIINFVKGAVYNAFVPLTEMPILFKYLKGKDKNIEDKPQIVRDSNGGIIAPFDPKDSSQTDTGFRMAPMSKIISMTPEDSYDEIMFTDFKLDGTSNNIYFYGVKELSSKLKMSNFSPFLGPVKLVNTKAAEKPEIKRIIPILGNDILGITPKISIEINAYPEAQNIKKLIIYRSNNKLDAQSILSMRVAKTIDLEESSLLNESIWNVVDDFDNLPEFPYGEGLFYRVVALREVEYADSNGNIITDYAPSEASKIVASLIVETKSPVSPNLEYYSEPINQDGELHNVLLQWNKTAYNGKYHLYKMNPQGNWVKIYEISSNDDIIQVYIEDTDFGSDIINTLDEDGNQVFHHFKAISENTSNMLSTETNILTIYNEETWNNISDI